MFFHIKRQQTFQRLLDITVKQLKQHLFMFTVEFKRGKVTKPWSENNKDDWLFGWTVAVQCTTVTSELRSLAVTD